MDEKMEVCNDYGDGYSTPPIHPLDIYLLVLFILLGMFSVPLSLYLTMK